MLWAWPAAALAARVLVLGAGGHAVVRDDPFLTLPASTPAPSSSSVSTAAPARARPRTDRNVRTELARLHRMHAISLAAFRLYLTTFNSALRAQHHLRGRRAAELEAVIENLHSIAARGLLTASRLPALFQTLERNHIWWTTGPLLSYGQRVEFADSELVWEYYPGQGIALQELGSFGKADGLYTAGPLAYPQLRQLLSELIPLAAKRAGGLTWEYYFRFDGGVPPWTSAMSQGTALEALTRGYEAFGGGWYLDLAHRALPVFGAAPPAGVGVNTRRGRRYIQYSFAPSAHDEVINAFLQTLIGLYDYARVSRDPRAARLFAAGDAEARFELPRFDTGSWSLYQPGVEDSLEYHTLVTGFLHELCARTHAPVYCTTAARFDAYLKRPPAFAAADHAGTRGRALGDPPPPTPSR
jgi:D-glucuronyl C5-epimerase C-terminus